MDEIEKIRLKSAALAKARDYLRSQTPPDPAVVAAISADIDELQRCHFAAAFLPEIPKLSADEQRQLEQAAATLNESIDRKDHAAEILKYARALFDLSPWSPKVTIGKYYAVDASEGEAPAADIIRFHVRRGTSVPDEYSALQIDIDRTLAVLKVVFFPSRKTSSTNIFQGLPILPGLHWGRTR